ncbi:MAG TPA: hypothetical protein VJX67_04205, partial [Blastocatellia bacterium]|nr:hypothetical protein [Blastocatellia bacterium]
RSQPSTVGTACDRGGVIMPTTLTFHAGNTSTGTGASWRFELDTSRKGTSGQIGYGLYGVFYPRWLQRGLPADLKEHR